MLFSCDEYNSDIFVDRPATLAKIRSWADAEEVDKRVIPVVAPPGGGKTWMLERLKPEWNNSGTRFVTQMNVPDLVHQGETRDRNQMIRREGFEKWFRQVQQEAAGYFSIPPISETPDISAILSAFVRLVCDSNPNTAPIIIVDGYDELSDLQAEVFSSRILQPLLEKECIRMIIAHRPERSIRGDAVRRNLQDPPLFLHELDPLSPDFAMQQFHKLFQNVNPGLAMPDPKVWMDQITHYQWNHPLANCFLFNRGMAGGWQDLSSQDFYECCKIVIERPGKNGNNRFPPLSTDESKTQHRVANELPDHWSQTELETLLGINNFILDPTVTKLFQLGLINSVPSVPVLYQICDGLRELLREINITQITS